MSASLTAASTTIFSSIRTTVPGQVNVQNVPTSRVQHFSPSPIGAAGSSITAYQLMNGALTGAPILTTAYTMPTATNLLQAYSGNQQRVQPGDIFRISVFNPATAISMSTTTATGGTGSFTSSAGPSESLMHINWLQVSADGNSGVYQLF